LLQETFTLIVVQACNSKKLEKLQRVVFQAFYELRACTEQTDGQADRRANG